MTFSRKLAIPLTAVASIVLATPMNAATLTSSVVSGSPNPTLLPNAAVGDTITNGGFTILQQIQSPQDNNTLGNGINDTTLWTFDFTGEDVDAFLADGPISSAILTFVLAPQDQFITTDSTGILLEDGSFGTSIPIPSIPNIPPVGNQGEISIDIISFGFNGNDISNALVSGTFGQLGWFYIDDAIISSAQLELNTTPDPNPDPVSVPEPATLLGLAAVAGIGFATRRKLAETA